MTKDIEIAENGVGRVDIISKTQATVKGYIDLAGDYPNDVELAQEIEKKVNEKLEQVIPIDLKVLVKDFDGLLPLEQAVYVIEGFLREVNNGGVEQYFCNSSGIWIEELVLILKNLEAPKIYIAMKTLFDELVKLSGFSGVELKQKIWIDDVDLDLLLQHFTDFDKLFFKECDISEDYVRGLVGDLSNF